MLNNEEMVQRCSSIILREEKLLLMFRRLKGREFYVLPGGRMQIGETQEAALAREIMEETSLTVKKAKLVLEICDYVHKYVEHIYVCVCNDQNPKIIGEECLKNSKDNFYRLDWVSLSHIPSLTLYSLYAKEWIIEMNAKNSFQTLLSEIG
ncbi:MAG: NUDIX domain-containing protein [Bacteroidales bacterium]|jgi:ADP-ribose pyrophosphatase YjhB (NUDIX family)|nr:NUDIX domain-containing protein [Bacteroidales bacterium]